MGETLSITKGNSSVIAPLGKVGEELALEHLKENGFRIVVTNFKVPVGRNSKGVAVTGEIDIIAIDGKTLCFIEVKTRRSDEFTPIITAVDKQKQRQITRTAKVYRRIFNIHDIEIRYDAVTVLMRDQTEPEINIIKEFWTENSIKKKAWSQNAWYDFS